MRYWQITRPELDRLLERAHEERARAIRDMLRGAAVRFARAVRRAAAALARRRLANATARELGALDDRLLADIGIMRSEIGEVVSGRARPRRFVPAAPAEPPAASAPSAAERAIDPAHELRTPLTAILSISEILRDNPDLPRVRREEFLDIVIAESERLDRAIDQVVRMPRAA